jgi:ABC-type transport system substrate-binding protein
MGPGDTAVGVRARPLNGSWQVRQALYLTCVALLNYPDKPAPDGWTLEPEVADAMPTVSPDGKTCTFTIKLGFMFSPPSNEPVTAETFRATIARALSPVFDDHAPGPQNLSDIAGAKEYRAGTIDHVTGLAASGDRLTIVDVERWLAGKADRAAVISRFGTQVTDYVRWTGATTSPSPPTCTTWRVRRS